MLTWTSETAIWRVSSHHQSSSLGSSTRPTSSALASPRAPSMAPCPRCQSMPLLDTATPAQSPSMTLSLCQGRNAHITRLPRLPKGQCLGYVLWLSMMLCQSASPCCHRAWPSLHAVKSIVWKCYYPCRQKLAYGACAWKDRVQAILAPRSATIPHQPFVLALPHKAPHLLTSTMP